MRLPRGIWAFIAVFQSVLLVVHFFLYETWTYSWAASAAVVWWLRLAAGVLSISFLSTSLLTFRYTNAVLRTIYRVAAVWLGTVSFLFFAACLSWVTLEIARVAGITTNTHELVEFLFGLGAGLAVVATINASWTRVRRISVKLPDLPAKWVGRKAALVSDLHLGNVRNGGFLRRIVAMVMQEKPDIVFVAGDLYDGTEIDAVRAAEPLRGLQAPFGTFFVAGNHEQFGDDTKYLSAVSAAGVRVLSNEKVDADRLQIVGVPYRHATHDEHFRSVLAGIGVDRGRASILLTHAPDRPGIAEEAGISLQLSGHTHVGQFYPWSWMARRIYRQFVYGLSRIGGMQVYTSSGAGTWGPPLRLGSNPEIVIIEFA
jgi:predicted MPP superfamily phosphohydrolase